MYLMEIDSPEVKRPMAVGAAAYAPWCRVLKEERDTDVRHSGSEAGIEVWTACVLYERVKAGAFRVAGCMRFTATDEFDGWCSRELFVRGNGRMKLRHGAWRAADMDGHSSLAVETTF
jgi:hypothetical protein